MFRKQNKQHPAERNHAKQMAKETRAFGDLAKRRSGYGIMERLLEAYRAEPMGVTKACVVYGMMTGLGLRAGKIVARELGEKI